MAHEVNHQKCLVFLDPGHGGKDAGYSDLEIQEKNLTLIWAKKWQLEASKLGFLTVLSRNSDETLTSQSRYQRFKESQCESWVSLHFNSYPKDRSRFGTVLISWMPQGWGSDDVHQWLIMDVYKWQNFHKAFRLKASLQSVWPKRPITVLMLPIKSIRLAFPKPAILIELAYLTNFQDRSLALNYDLANQWGKEFWPKFAEIFLTPSL